MIRVNFVLRRRPGMSAQDFENIFRNVYGPLVAKYQSILELQKYIQSYTLLKDTLGAALRAARPEMHEPFDGTAAFWWPNRERMAAALGSPAGKAALAELIECERTFADLSRSCIFLTREIPQINPMPEDCILAKNGSPIVKLIYVLHALPALGRAGCQVWWQTRHGAITRRYGAAMGFLRYIQSHSFDDPLHAALANDRGTLAAYDGMTEVWFDRLYLDSVIRNPDCEGSEGFGLLLEDEYKFVDLSGASTWFAKEQVLIER
ncbi:MAG: EthD domain-containing protein [Betaproteobacteria bacterium]|nr:EthD domain-containing protein [Betaproteobacteria bacterium]